MRLFCLCLFFFASTFASEFTKEEIQAYKQRHQESIREQETVELSVETFLMTSSLSTTYSDQAQLYNIGMFTVPVDVNNHRTDSINPEYNWGLTLEALYRIPPTRTGLSFTYTYILNNGDDTLKRDVTFVLPSSGQQRNIQNDRGHQHTHLHIIDLLGSRLFPIYEHISFGLGGGLTYQELHYYFTMHDAGELINFNNTGTVTSTFALDLKAQRTMRAWGLGPKLQWHFGFHFTKATGNQDVSLDFTLQIATLFGKIWSQGNYSAFWSGTGAVTPTSNGGRWDKSPDFQVIPNLNANIGLKYKYAFKNNVSLMLNVGYKVYTYWEVEEMNRTILFRLIPSSLIPDRAQEEKDSAIFAGPYLRLSVGF